MSFIRSGLQTLLVRLALAVLTLGIGIMNARWLGPEGVGIIALLLLVKSFAFRFGNFGFGSSFTYFVAKRQAGIHEIITMAGKLTLLFSGVSMLIFFALWKSPVSPWNDIGLGNYAIALAALPFAFYNNYFHRLLNGRLRITRVNVASATSAVSLGLFTVLFVIVLKGGVTGAIGAALSAEMVMTALLFHYARLELKDDVSSDLPSQVNDGAGLLCRLWRYGRWNYFLMITNLLVEEVPTVLLKKFTLDNALVGFFNRARSLGRQSQLVIEPVAGVLFPFTAASKEHEATRRTNLLCRNSVFIMGVTITALMLFIKPLIVLLYGEAFLPAADIFYVLAPGVIVYPFGQFLEVHVAASGKPRDIFFSSLLTLVVAVIACVTLIPQFGAIGTGLSVSLIYLARALFRFIVYVRMTKAPVLDVLLPKVQDLSYYQHVFRLLTAGAMKKFRPT